MPISDLRNITAFLFLAACIICSIGWLLLETRITGNDSVLSYYDFSSWISSSFASMAIACAIMVVMLFMKADVRFLCIPIVVQSLRYVLTLVNSLSIYYFTISKCFSMICAISIILLFVLLFHPIKKEMPHHSWILYMLPGICRALFFWGGDSRLQGTILNITSGWGLILHAAGGWRMIGYALTSLAYNILISIAYILLGMLLQKLAMEKSTANALTQ